MATTNYNIRLDQDLRDRAFSVFESYGLAPAQAIKLFLNQVADTHTVPLSFTHNARVPNAETLAAIQEIMADRKSKNLKRYDGTEELLHDIREESE